MSKFKEAFAAARKSGKKTFTWNGKSYNTKTKDDVKSATDDVKSATAKAAKKAKPQVSPKKRAKGNASGELAAVSKSKAMSGTKRKSKVKPDRSKRTSPYNTARAKAGQRYVNRNKKKTTGTGGR